jgi:UDP-N-acetyl-D-glucosamine/UDP-N-acetyl-D-galactosamine dehydrogenase
VSRKLRSSPNGRSSGPGPIVAVIGLGYVGLPLAVQFGLAGVRVIGIDANPRRIAELEQGIDRTGEVDPEHLRASKLVLASEPERVGAADFIIIAVPTPITPTLQPDLSAVASAAEAVGSHLREGSIVVLESTVFPGVTEEVVGPIVERVSRMRAGVDFFLAYSPERANPGDKEHTVADITKVVAAQDRESLEAVAQLYGRICRGGVYRAPNIKTAEAAKVVENVQRDLNIALMNELSLIFQQLGLETSEVLHAANTKWNFHSYQPGLVGGHCIDVDPYYLAYAAERVGYHPEVILAGRRVNEHMATHVADLVIKGLIEAGKVVKDSEVLILGLTFKENVNDTRNSKVEGVVRRLREYGVKVLGCDPLLQEEEIRNHFNVRNVREFSRAPIVDAVVVAVPHKQLRTLTLEAFADRMRGRPLLVDVKSVFSKVDAEAAGFIYKAL